MNPVFVIPHEAALPFQISKVKEMASIGLRAGEVVIELKRGTRNAEQNRKLWAMLHDVSKQVQWHGMKLKPDEWKDVFSAALRGQKCVPGIDGGVVFFGLRTSQMSKKAFAELIEFIYSFGAENGVVWSEPEGSSDGA